MERYILIITATFWAYAKYCAGLYNLLSAENREKTVQLRIYQPIYIGSMVADLHRTLIKKSGIFMYPGHIKKPAGKLKTDV